ncbi:MAG: LemA family protein [Alphaproteobacteria bacterium]
MLGFYVLVSIAAVLLIVFVVTYNALIAKRQMVNNGWADIDVQLKRRADLIPQLVNVVQGYAAHEKQLFVDITEKRNQALAAGGDAAQRGAAESALAKPVAQLIAVAESYPELKASQNFLDLQNQLSDTENKIEMARRFYNGAVRELNTLVESFPSNFVASVSGTTKRAFFEIEGADRAAPQVKLGQNS